MIKQILDFVRDLVEARESNPGLVPFASGVAEEQRAARLSVLNASEFGRCGRQSWYRRNVPEGDAATPGAFGVQDRGRGVEEWAVPMVGAVLAKRGGRLIHAGEEQERLVAADIKLAGTPDGLMIEKTGVERVLEIKSHGPQADRSRAPSPTHVKQAEVNVELYNRVTRHRPDGAVLLYVRADDFSAMNAFYVPRRPAVLAEAIGKARNVLEATDPREVIPTPGSLCGYCPFRDMCAAADRDSFPLGERLDPEHVGELDAAALSFLDAKAAADAAGDVLEERKVALKAVMRRINTRTANRPNYTLTLSQVQGRTSLDREALADAVGDLRPYEKQGEPSERLVVRGR